MIYELVEKLDRAVGIEKASAHCDIPCGIYDPITAQIAALTVIRMIDLMTAPVTEPPFNSLARYVAVKEEHAIKCKEEIRIIWGDYFKPEHVDKYPALCGLVHRIMKLGSQCKQTVDRDAALALLKAINEFAEIFWETKGINTQSAKAPYPPGEEVVYPVLW